VDESLINENLSKENLIEEIPLIPEGDIREDIRQTKEIASLLKLKFVEKLADPKPPYGLAHGEFDKLTGSWARQHSIVPIGEEDNHVLVATSNPLNMEAIDQLKFCYGRPIRLLVTSPNEIARVINSIRTNLMSDRTDTLESSEDSDYDLDQGLKIDVTDASDDDAPIIRYVNLIIFKASSERASDVHIEPFENKLNVRFRIDGVLYDVDSKTKGLQAAITSRLKVMAGLNIAEKRLPQDGRIGINIAGRSVDIRVSTIPTQFGERVVLRLLDKSATVLDLEQLGVNPRSLATLKSLIKKPNGIVLVTGPTGSGKTTTLYSCLSYINTPELNILTVEDPIEYQLDGIGQMQVNPKINFTFASGLRAILRQDPDVVMVGEIRDSETAEIAIQASLTGHLVLSTLHTNDSPGAITRLIDMGVEPFLISSSLLAVVAQRLVRRLCPKCRQPYQISAEEIQELGLTTIEAKGKTIYRRGELQCDNCQGTGFLGRMGIHEVLVIDEEIRTAILQRPDSSSIRQAAAKQSFESLRSDGAKKVLAGLTSVHEVVVASHEDVS
jgi:general secretion pathway protein E